MSDEWPGQEATTGPRRPGTPPHSLVVCSLEPWTDVRRRLRILVDEMVAADPTLAVLYVAPAVDPLHLQWAKRTAQPDAGCGVNHLQMMNRAAILQLLAKAAASAQLHSEIGGIA